MPLVSEVKGPDPLIGAIPAKPPRKKKRKPYRYKTVELSRCPTPLEERLLSLQAISPTLDRLTMDLVRALGVLTPAPRLGGVQAALRDLFWQTARTAAAYGAYEHRQEWQRQGLTTHLRSDAVLARLDHDLPVRRQIHEQVEQVLAGDSGLLRRMARSLVNRSFALGRKYERQRLIALKAVEPEMLVFTSLLDAHTCGECEDADGTTFEEDSPEAQEYDVPYARCESTASGTNYCRCQIIAVGSEPGWVNAAIEHLEILHLREDYDLDALTPEERSQAAVKAWDVRGRHTTFTPDKLKTRATTTNPSETGFVLPDGTRIKRTGEHRNIAAPFRLEEVLDAGVIRYQAGGGVHIRAPMTDIQAALIADDWNHEYTGRPLFVDAGQPGTPAFDSDHMDVQRFDPPIHADAVRRWVNSHYGPDATRGFTPVARPVAARTIYPWPEPIYAAFLLGDEPHPLTPEERHDIAVKAWDTRGRLHGVEDVTATYDKKQGQPDLVGRHADWTPRDGGCLFVGTTVQFFPQLAAQPLAYLTDDFNEAMGYAEGRHDIGGGHAGTPVVRTITAKPGRTLSIDTAIAASMEDDTFSEETLQGLFTSAKRAGARYVVYNHPAFSRDAEQHVVVSLYPAEDLGFTSHATHRSHLAADPHPLTPEERSAASKKAWDTRGRTGQQDRATATGDRPSAVDEASQTPIRSAVETTRQALGFPADRIRFVTDPPPKFQVGDQVFEEAAHFDRSTGLIHVNLRGMSPETSAAVMAHEIMHAMFHQVDVARSLEHGDIMESIYAGGLRDLFDVTPGPDGLTVRAKADKMDEIRKRYPATAVFGAYWGDSLFPDATATRNSLIARDGHTPYTKAYWQEDYFSQPAGLRRVDRALTETLADVAYSSTLGRAANVPTRWLEFAEAVQRAYAMLNPRHAWQAGGRQ